MSCKKELDVGYPQVTIIVIEWTKTFFSRDRKWIELKIRQNSTAKISSHDRNSFAKSKSDNIQ